MSCLSSLTLFGFMSQVSFSQDLLLTGIISRAGSGPGSTTTRAIELYVINDINDLSIYGIAVAENGGAPGTTGFTLSGMATEGDFIYITEAQNGFNAFFAGGGISATTDAGLTIDGNDVVQLYYNTDLIDVYGVVGTDGTGEPWEYTDGWAYRMDVSLPSATFDVNDWTYSGVDALDGVSANGQAGDDAFPTGTYLNKLPSSAPSSAPSVAPSVSPSSAPSFVPTITPTAAPVVPNMDTMSTTVDTPPPVEGDMTTTDTIVVMPTDPEGDFSNKNGLNYYLYVCLIISAMFMVFNY